MKLNFMKNFKLIAVFVLSLLIFSACATSADMKADIFSTDKSLKDTDEIIRLLTNQIIGDLQIIDVRTPSEFHAGCLNGAKNIDFEAPDFAIKIAGMDKNADYLLYCRSGRRSALAVAKLREMGFKNIIELKGGFNAWTAAGDPISQSCN